MVLSGTLQTVTPLTAGIREDLLPQPFPRPGAGIQPAPLCLPCPNGPLGPSCLAQLSPSQGDAAWPFPFWLTLIFVILVFHTCSHP